MCKNYRLTSNNCGPHSLFIVWVLSADYPYIPCTLWCRLPCCCVLRTHSSCLRYLCYALPACPQSRPSKQRKQSLSYHKNNKPSGNRRIQSINIPTVKTRDKTFDSVQLILIKLYNFTFTWPQVYIEERTKS